MTPPPPPPHPPSPNMPPPTGGTVAGDSGRVDAAPTTSPTPPAAPLLTRHRARLVSWVIAGLLVVWLSSALAREFRPMAAETRYDYQTFGKLPVSYGGRFKPLATVARNAALLFGGRQELVELDPADVPDHWRAALDDPSEADATLDIPATWWLTETLADPRASAELPLFRVDHPEVRTLVGQGENPSKRLSYAEIDPKLPGLFEVARQADALDKASRTAFQNEALELAGNVSTFLGLANQESIHSIPTDAVPTAAANGETAEAPQEAAADWEPMRVPHDHADHAPGQHVEPIRSEHNLAYRAAYEQLYRSYATGDAAGFNQRLTQLHERFAGDHPAVTRRAAVEWHFNHFAPFTKAMVLYILAGLLVVFSWVVAPRVLLATAWKVTVVALLVHTVALAVRVYLSGRPPVTNLYSSAVFIGWGVVLLSLLLEPLLRRGLGLIVGISVGVVTLLIAQGLSADGDTMAVLQAVLDTNLWLATHVIIITLGYVAAFVAGALGILYVIMGVFTKALDRGTARRLATTIYGTVCFCVLLSFVGTILGGIWADQSWGRFWGWDPKENGALMIVIWNAVILHARWGHLVRERGLALLAILGNIVTAWSWFGVNLLGAGLHSYGFTEAGEGGILEKLLNPGPKEWLLLFVLSQLLIVVLGSLPTPRWRSFARPRVSSSAPASESRRGEPRTQPA